MDSNKLVPASFQSLGFPATPPGISPPNKITRRRTVAGVGASLVGIRSSIANEAVQTLRGAAAERGVRYGSAAETNLTKAPAPFATLFKAQCALLSPALPWSIARATSQSELPSYDANIAFAHQNGLPLTGAHLLWHFRLPAWFKQLSRTDAQRAMASHVTSMTARLAGRVYSWNVVNEALDPRDGRRDGLRVSPLLIQLGPDFIAQAFSLARKADPAALLLYNDFGMEASGFQANAKRSALLALLDRLMANKTPIDGIGLQGHLRLKDRFDGMQFRGFLRDIASRGLRIVITELDVLDIGAPGSFAERDRAVAACYERFLSVALDERATMAVVSWGLSDRYTWLTPKSEAFFRRPDGLPTRPLPFDDEFRPKPAFWALLHAFQSAPTR